MFLPPWAIIWRPLTGASEALIPDIPFSEFPDPLASQPWHPIEFSDPLGLSASGFLIATKTAGGQAEVSGNSIELEAGCVRVNGASPDE
jgi:hypothetical protein